MTLAAKNEAIQFSMRRLLVAVAIVAVVFACLAALQRRVSRRNAEIARLAKQSERTKVDIVERIDAIRVKLGRVPRDQAELEEMLGEPMPAAYEDGIAEPITYKRTGASSYRLKYTSYYDDDWNYVSD
jgi:HAMP domain-containing protein